MSAFKPSAIKNLEAGFDALFQRGMANKQIQILWPQKATRVFTPGKKINVYGWMAETPRFRKWVGDRVMKRLKARSYTLENEDYELGFSIGVDDLKYDTLNIWAPRAQISGQAARVVWDDVLTTVQKAGLTSTCYDGQNFYDDDHPVSLEDASLGTFQNKWFSMALTSENYRTRYAYMANLKDANGEPFGSVPTVLECSVADEFTANEIVKNAHIMRTVMNNAGTDAAGAATIENVAQGTVVVMPNPRLDQGTWYLHSSILGIMPFIVQVETEPTGLVARIDPASDNVFLRKELEFGSTATGAAGYTFPQLSCYCKTAAS